MAGLFRLLLIILVIYLGFRFVIKPLLRILLQYMVKKVVNNSMEDFKRQNQASQPKRPEGTIFVDYVPDGKSKSKPPKDKDEGEYVDYEEVK